MCERESGALQPELTPKELWTELSRVAPEWIEAFTWQLCEAATRAEMTDRLGPLREFAHSWALFLSVQRHPERAVLLRALEEFVTGPTAGTKPGSEPVPVPVPEKESGSASETEVGEER
ncbi:hypothetical protein [Streptomyces sp. NPDC087212]|uniref:hypothetical protein n=1 Tax=Streptomyces sp. NPDC087212 TaxID=3365766 RepID=UPI0037FEB1A3